MFNAPKQSLGVLVLMYTNRETALGADASASAENQRSIRLIRRFGNFRLPPPPRPATFEALNRPNAPAP